MKDKIYTRLQIIEELKNLLNSQASYAAFGWWGRCYSDWNDVSSFGSYRRYDFDYCNQWGEDDEKICSVLDHWSRNYSDYDEEFIHTITDKELQDLKELVDKFWNISLLYPMLIEFRKDFDEWKNIDKFVKYAGCVFRNEGLVAFPLFLSYVSYFNDKDYSDLVGDDLRAIQPLEPDFYVKEFISNVYLLISPKIHPYFIDYSRNWAIEILYNILESVEHNKCLDKYLSLADKGILFDLMGEVVRDYYNKDDVPTRIQELRDKLGNER